MIYNIYIYNRQGACLYYREWARPYNSFPLTEQGTRDERQLVYGMIFSLKELIGKMKSKGAAAEDGLHCLKTDTFTLHHFETASGLRFVLNTDRNTADLRSNLVEIYSSLFVDLVVNNPSFDPASSDPVDSPLFEQALGDYIQGMSCFR
jgi:hypothetical protein